MNNINYIKDIRSLVGNQNIILNFAGGVLVNNKNEILLQRRSDSKLWGLPGGAMELGETGQKTLAWSIYRHSKKCETWQRFKIVDR